MCSFVCSAELEVASVSNAGAGALWSLDARRYHACPRRCRLPRSPSCRARHPQSRARLPLRPRLRHFCVALWMQALERAPALGLAWGPWRAAWRGPCPYRPFVAGRSSACPSTSTWSPPPMTATWRRWRAVPQEWLWEVGDGAFGCRGWVWRCFAPSNLRRLRARSVPQQTQGN
jgi:hypothetical protein